MTIEVSAFRWVPPFAQGLVRDVRVRWALEEAGLAYEARLIGPEDQNVRRCEARPAFQRALADQLSVPRSRRDGQVASSAWLHG